MTLFLCISLLAVSQSGESPYLFGLHDPGGESNMADKGRKGADEKDEGVGDDPNQDCSTWPHSSSTG